MTPETHTPARQDKHLAHTLLFVAIVVSNHKLGLSLTFPELGLLASVLGIYMGVSQIAAVSRFKALLGAPDAAATKE